VVVVVVVVVVVGSFSLLQRLVRQKHVRTIFPASVIELSHCSAVSAASPHLLKTLPVPSLTETIQCEVVSGHIVTLPTSSGLLQPTNWSHSWQVSGGGVVVVVVVVVLQGRWPESTFALSLLPPSEVFRTHLFWSALNPQCEHTGSFPQRMRQASLSSTSHSMVRSFPW